MWNLFAVPSVEHYSDLCHTSLQNAIYMAGMDRILRSVTCASSSFKGCILTNFGGPGVSGLDEFKTRFLEQIVVGVILTLRLERTIERQLG